MFAGKWAMCGFPTVDITHRVAASFMATSVPAEEVDRSAKLPWPAFVVRVPGELLGVRGNVCVRAMQYRGLPGRPGPGVVVAATGDEVDIMREGLEDAFALHIPFETTGDYMSGALHRTDKTLGRLITPTDAPDLSYPLSMEVEDRDSRALLVTATLLCNLCLHLSSPEGLRGVSSTKAGNRKRKRDGKQLPPYERFEVRLPVTVDVKDAVREYVSVGGRSPKVQTLVRGHWKRQAYGANKAQRKMIHVEPYWRGPLDGPVLDKSGVLS